MKNPYKNKARIRRMYLVFYYVIYILLFSFFFGVIIYGITTGK